MVLIGLKISFLIYNSYSLKDKRSVVKSIVNRMHNKHNVSIAEIEDHDILNKGVIGIGVVGNSYVLCQQILDAVLKDIENNYEIEVHDVEKV